MKAVEPKTTHIKKTDETSERILSAVPDWHYLVTYFTVRVDWDWASNDFLSGPKAPEELKFLVTVWNKPNSRGTPAATGWTIGPPTADYVAGLVAEAMRAESKRIAEMRSKKPIK